MKFKMLLISILMLGLAIGTVTVGSGTDADFSSLLKLISPAVVSVQALVDPEEEVWANASGFIIDPSGKVITACHAVLGAAKVIVELQDGTSYDATVERCSDHDIEAKLHDIAVLQLQEVTRYLPQVWLGDSDDVDLGEEVMVLSYPGPYGEFNVVKGEISGRLSRQYLTLGNEIYRAALLIQLDHREDGYYGGAVIDLDSSHPSLESVIEFAEKDTLVIAVEEPNEEDLFCGMVSTVEGQEITVDELDCSWLIGWGIIDNTGRTAKLNHEVEFLKTSAPINGGSSGGPLFNLSGQVIGLVGWSRSVEIEEDEWGDIEDIHLWTATNFIVRAEAIQSILADS